MKKQSWKDIPQEHVAPKMKRKFVYGKEIMISKMEFEDGFEVPWHFHENEQITNVTFGTIRLWFDHNEEDFIDIHADEVIVIESNRPHKARMIGSVEVTDTFSPPRQDWIEGTDDYLKK